MAQSPYRVEYASRAFVPFPGNLLVMVANLGDTHEVVRVFGYDARGTLLFDSTVPQPEPSVPYDPEGRVPPGHTWSYSFDSDGDVVQPIRVVVHATSDRMVPSIHNRFVQQQGSQFPQLQTRTVCWPGNFAVFPLHTPPVEPPVAPVDPPIFVG
jgi:hypothetical protein